MLDFAGKTTAELETLIANYRRLGQERSQTYVALLAERERRVVDKDQLLVDRSLELLKQAARQKIYVTYGDLAKASQQKWSNTIRARMSGPNGHLDRLLDICHSQGLPLLTALCVNENGRGTGLLDPPARAGFINGARRLGRLVTNEDEFYKTCQRECFVWGLNHPEATPVTPDDQATAPPGPPAAPARQ
jgi:hypothetical protein